MSKKKVEELLHALSSRLPPLNKSVAKADKNLGKAEAKLWDELEKLPRWNKHCNCGDGFDLTDDEDEELSDSSRTLVDYNNSEYGQSYCLLCGGGRR